MFVSYLILTLLHVQTAVLARPGGESIGCDDYLGSDKVVDKCGVCGGDNTGCQVVSGVFKHALTSLGYHRVVEIPEGATKINITEMYKSNKKKSHLKPATRGSQFSSVKVCSVPAACKLLGTPGRARQPVPAPRELEHDKNSPHCAYLSLYLTSLAQSSWRVFSLFSYVLIYLFSKYLAFNTLFALKRMALQRDRKEKTRAWCIFIKLCGREIQILPGPV
ncbi:LOW QUALITY PROTEIN: thrombospondin type 1 domain containing 4 [Homo sapiens]|uniref:Isoform 3 of Thrombospondin type-1 domain-containing protein 4 n=1 Tax=Homo sapiens TaxID=9606 RepID=Q6ZMP0-3|nr:FVSY9334 [Homo sapiens]KAI2574938.1 LOW QUALITY PROTEIN: thrombospondin type 1 domain containing 4 [Homo sapiens]KAI4058541.1 LOW QUALITY PROTEIN: thrombospondin type 1 domain containing 4 [Homo sapiens]